MSPGVLYISYDGMLEPLGQSQVLAYLERLAPGRRIHLISFEKRTLWKEESRREAIAARIAKAGIGWHPLRYHKSPTAPATAFDIAAGTAVAITLALRHSLRIVHARSYVAGAMALAVKRVAGAKFLFDMRGFWADERADGGLWRAGSTLFRAAKAMERRLLLGADHVVVLTRAAEKELRQFPYLADRMPPVTVIPTCADLGRFDIQRAPRNAPFVLGYVGSVTGWPVLDEMLKAFRILTEQSSGARLLIVNRGEHSYIEQCLRALGIEGDVELREAEHAEVPAQIARMSAGMAFYKPAWSRAGCAPTKLAEYLGCGVPCIGNAGIGDMGDILERERVGVAVEDFSEPEMRAAIRRLLDLSEEAGLQGRCRKVALRFFSLAGGAELYSRIYDGLVAR